MFSCNVLLGCKHRLVFEIWLLPAVRVSCSRVTQRCNHSVRSAVVIITVIRYQTVAVCKYLPRASPSFLIVFTIEAGSQQKPAVERERWCADRATEQEHHYLSRGEGWRLGVTVCMIWLYEEMHQTCWNPLTSNQVQQNPPTPPAMWQRSQSSIGDNYLFGKFKNRRALVLIFQPPRALQLINKVVKPGWMSATLPC